MLSGATLRIHGEPAVVGLGGLWELLKAQIEASPGGLLK